MRYVTPEFPRFEVSRTPRRLNRHDRVVLIRLIDAVAGLNGRTLDANTVSEAVNMRDKIANIRRGRTR